MNKAVRVLVAGAVALGASVPLAATSQAIAPGCYEGQVGIYEYANYGGHCYGFISENSDLSRWPIWYNMHSAWNGGTQNMSVRIYSKKDYAGSVVCLNMAQHTNTSQMNALSNTWKSAKC